ncbi:MAG: histidine phosphatase family protein [Candidatus Parcubacteria bacterium]|nr:histidine phosphatase family protein [Candidatus Parcubacteria bacterium]
MTTVYIVRHAEVVYPRDELGKKLMYPLSAPISSEGKNQLVDFARNLQERGIVFNNIETSPATRAVESAQILSNILGGEIIPNAAFTDSHVPGYIGIPISLQQELMDKGEDIYQNPRSSDQEPYDAITKRMLQGFNDLVKKNEGKTVALVSHGDPIRLLMYRLEHPEGEIPNMSILSKEGYLKRGEAYCVKIGEYGRIVETELISNLGLKPGEREIYMDQRGGSERGT